MEGSVLDALEFADVGDTGGREPDWSGIGDYGFEDGFKGEEDCFFVRTP